MNRRKLETLLLTLESTAALLARAAENLSAQQTCLKPEGGGFSLRENIWHLADLEREGFAARIQRILAEDEPFLPDFNGDRLARERCYNERDLAQGLDAFREARARNIEVLRHAARSDWKRRARQEGVGRISLDDIPRQMAQHDASHTREIAELISNVLEGKAFHSPCSSAVA
ncbi:MAG TPA: DinB family protein [Thermoanaerobaculia bacterium]|nr:DinB family protein [Thermoanaerobaculia bacterium]